MERTSALLRRDLHKEYSCAVRGRGAYLWDSNGRRYLDFSGSATACFIGHGDEGVARVMAEQARSLEFAHTSQFTTPVAEEFAWELLEFAGEAFRGGAVCFTSGGSESTETALKLARQYQVEIGQKQRYQIISRKQGYHGATLGALAVSGNVKRREMYLPMVREFEQVRTPNCYRCSYACDSGCDDCGWKYAEEVRGAIDNSNGEAAAFIFEPVSGATLGAVVPPKSYLPRVCEVCRREGVLLIADEVMTGFGRTGRNFAFEHWNVAPDIMVLAKGISSGYAPLGAVVANKKVVDAIANGSGALVHGFTYNAHSVAVAAGREVLRRIVNDKLVLDAAAKAELLGDALRGLYECRSVGDVRGLGLLWGVEFVTSKETKDPFKPDAQFATKIAAACAARGVMVYPMQGCVDGYKGDHLLIAPPVVITEEQIKWAVERVKAAVKEVEDAVGS
ncbi:MAG TPA: aminotransferase class III-fold pyridoxal phosphate-dependent enzyme [Terriglobales bacterium]|nr:aminotransferase class III-fold pyridoxal phosphate-dependent enzyme [Terriglobales bacterium]